MADREHDIVVFGATGFTGELTAEYLAAHAPARRAGRSRAAARTSSSACASASPRSTPRPRSLPLIEADVDDAGVDARAGRVGERRDHDRRPVQRVRRAVVAACAAAGTDYVDLTGEPEFVDLMWLRYHEQRGGPARALVHSCGFDSIPYDLGALFTVVAAARGRADQARGIRARVGGGSRAARSTRRSRSWAGSRQASRSPAQRRRLERKPEGRRVRGVTGAAPPQRDRRWLGGAASRRSTR